MNSKHFILILLAMILVLGCMPSSRRYQPLEWEEPLYASSTKAVFPSDLRKHPDNYTDEIIHWVGIIKDYELTDGEKRILELTIDQKYWDYIEDFSIQTETIFLSSAGEGLFRFVIESTSPLSYEEQEKELADMVNREDLALVYGKLHDFDGDVPILQGLGLRTIHEMYYSTKIWYYEIERNADGSVAVDENGWPIKTNFKSLTIPKAGEND